METPSTRFDSEKKGFPPTKKELVAFYETEKKRGNLEVLRVLKGLPSEEKPTSYSLLKKPQVQTKLVETKKEVSLLIKDPTKAAMVRKLIADCVKNLPGVSPDAIRALKAMHCEQRAASN